MKLRDVMVKEVANVAPEENTATGALSRRAGHSRLDERNAAYPDRSSGG
jgi:hypothetical protein